MSVVRIGTQYPEPKWPYVVLEDGSWDYGRIPQGQRHEFLRDQTHRFYRETQLPDEKMWELVSGLNERFCDPPKTDEEVRRAMGDYKQFAPDSDDKYTQPAVGDPARTGPRDVHQVAAFVGLPAPATRWRVCRLIPGEGFVPLIGAWKEGKTLTSIQMALCIAAGEPFMGRDVEQGTVLLIEEEGNLAALQEHIRSQAAKLGLLHRLADLPLHIAHRQRFTFDTPAGMVEVEAEIIRCGADVVFIGPLAQVAAIDENSNTDMNKVARLATELVARQHIALVLAHHRRKVGQEGPPRSVREFMESSRGAGALIGAADAAIGVSRDPESTEGMLYVLLRDGDPQRLPFVFEPASLTIWPDDSPRSETKAQLDDVESFVRFRWEQGETTTDDDVAAHFKVSAETGKERLVRLLTDGVLEQVPRGRKTHNYRPSER